MLENRLYLNKLKEKVFQTKYNKTILQRTINAKLKIKPEQKYLFNQILVKKFIFYTGPILFPIKKYISELWSFGIYIVCWLYISPFAPEFVLLMIIKRKDSVLHGGFGSKI